MRTLTAIGAPLYVLMGLQKEHDKCRWVFTASTLISIYIYCSNFGLQSGRAPKAHKHSRKLKFPARSAASWNKGIRELTARMLEKHKISAPASKCAAAGREVAHLWIIILRRRRRIIRKEGGGGGKRASERREQLIGGRRPLASSFPVIIRKQQQIEVWSGAAQTYGHLHTENFIL